MQRSTEQLARCSTETLEEVPQTEINGVKASNSTIRAKIMAVCRNFIRWCVLADLLLALSVFAVLGMLEFGMIPQQQLGFFCNDPKIAHKFRGDTIPFTLLLFGCTIVPFLMVGVIEYKYHASDSCNPLGGSRTRQIWSWYGHYLVGLTILALVCEIMKVLIGEPRPHFLDTCKPREAVNCTTNSYIDKFTCTNNLDTYWFVSDASRSFPSGHSALSVYSSFFLAWYLEKRLPTGIVLLKPWLQCLVCLWCVTCSLTRITDKRHHWWDVLSGIVMGLTFSAFVVILSCRQFFLEKSSSSLTFANDSMENGRTIFRENANEKIKKLLTSNSVDSNEGRELKDITSPWRE
ncbi:phospholipid phosphatase 1-like isoform X2 [Prorops nasuta]|uniref:phospholipid phosphatase 1-like isoform X2 n=1 Tax=Prorops nasuta TaxID=863751 RepID=UPI0034CF5C8A